MNLRQLEYFVMLADTEHMTQAASLLNTSQPNLSHSMSELEKELGAPLFEKTGRNIRLTKHGKFFYTYAANALNELNKGQRELHNILSPETGHIDFGFIYTMGSMLAPYFTRKFLEVPENSQIHFNFFQGNSKNIIQMLQRDEIDIALASKIANADEIHYQTIAEQKLVVVVPQNHPLAAKDALYLQETALYPYVYFNKQSGLRPYIDQLMKTLGLEPKIVCEVEEDHTLLGFVGFNFGIAVVPDIPTISSYPVKKIAILDQRDPRYIYLATRKDSTLSPAVQRFCDFCLAQKESDWEI